MHATLQEHLRETVRNDLWWKSREVVLGVSKAFNEFFLETMLVRALKILRNVHSLSLQEKVRIFREFKKNALLIEGALLALGSEERSVRFVVAEETFRRRESESCYAFH